MGQNQITGAAGDKYGREMARIVAKLLKTELLSNKSNEILLDEGLFVIKSARRKTTSIGITVKMLERLQGIIIAFENDDMGYTLYKVNLKETPPLQMVSSQSNSQKKNKVIKISRKTVQKYGGIIGII